jgi:hypothetical protein
MSQPTPPFPTNGLRNASTTGLPISDELLDMESSQSLSLGQDHDLGSDPDMNSKHKLVICRDGEIIRECFIGKQDISIGRKNSNDIQLNDLAMSGRHARISPISGYVYIEDLGSTNGTTVNGNHIKKVLLEHGDIIQMGQHQITYLNEGRAKFEPTMFFNAEQDKTQIIFSESGEAGNVNTGMPLAGLRERGSSRTKPVVELRKANSTIGFHGKCLALVTRNDDHYAITAVIGEQSRRATDIPLLNGQALDETQRILFPNDIITIAGFELEFYFLE